LSENVWKPGAALVASFVIPLSRGIGGNGARKQSAKATNRLTDSRQMWFNLRRSHTAWSAFHLDFIRRRSRRISSCQADVRRSCDMKVVQQVIAWRLGSPSEHVVNLWYS